MIVERSKSAFATLLVFGILGVSSVARAQRGLTDNGLGPRLAKSGTVPRDTAHERNILSQASVPTGFRVDVFAGPPVAIYPTSVATSPDGSVYVGVDLNLAQGAVKGRGRVMRLVDSDSDGHADSYTTFVEVESPRGIVVDRDRVFVMHPPNLTAYRDTNGDGIADDSVDVVRGLGFGLDVRSSDHSTNNVTLGLDGWLYVAVGDYGYRDATGTDGKAISHHGGSVVRVRPDGTGLEIYAVGTRNIYDVGIDPFGHVFARDNTNDGGGWNTRFHYLPPNAHAGYPSLFANFAEETMQPLFDFGAGAGTGGLWIQDAGFPPAWNNQLYTGDWTLNKVFFNPVQKRGASYSVTQRDFMTISHPVDFAMNDRSQMYVASLVGGVFNYAGDTVGAILRVSYPGRPAARPVNPARLSDAELVSVLGSSANSLHRLWAQRELLRRAPKDDAVSRLRAVALDTKRSAQVRATALFTVGLLAGGASHPFLVRAAANPELREVALRILVDDDRALADVPASLFVRALKDSNSAVRVQAINGLVRLGARDQARAITPLLASPDSALSHLAFRALASLGAHDAALEVLTSRAAAPQARTRARFALQQMHATATVTAVARALAAARDSTTRRELFVTLARLCNTEGPWNGDWWGTRPTTVGPYFSPANWEGTAATKAVLRAALAEATGSELQRLASVLAANRALPLGAAPLVVASAQRPDGDAVLDALLGESQISERMLPVLARLNSMGPEMHAAVGRMLAQETAFGPAILPLAQRAALDSTLSAVVRGQLLTSVANSANARDAATQLFAQVNPSPSAATSASERPGVALSGDQQTATRGAPAGDPVEAAWRRFVGARERGQQLDYFIELAKSGDAGQRTLAFAVLLQAIRNPRVQPTVREAVQAALTAGWADPLSAQSLARAVRIMRLEPQYAEQLKQVPTPQ